MQILSSNTSNAWLDSNNQAEVGGLEPRPSPAIQEARRVLSDIFRCGNLVVLAGLGTSLCVDDLIGGRLAPTMADLWTRVEQNHNDLEFHDFAWEDLLALVKHPDGDENLETLLSRCRLAESFIEGDDLFALQNATKAAEKVVYKSVDFLEPNHDLPIHTEFLRRIARRSNRKSRAKIFTTNYDRCFEEAARQGRYVVIDGFSHTSPPTFDAVNFTYDVVRRGRENDTQDYIPNLFHLYKLHGSIDWQREPASGEIQKVETPENPLLIYPRSTKYELAFEQPYLEMMAALQSCLREADTGLLVIGFGFNDNHLSEPIMAAIRSNLALKVAIISPNLAPWEDANGARQHGESGKNRHLNRVRDLIRTGDARLSLINATFQELMPLAPDLAAESDLERHVERLRKLDEAPL